jgi:lipopolysaccharide/colanic/teichoic acid biosynthesis glycosyltransferase
VSDAARQYEAAAQPVTGQAPVSLAAKRALDVFGAVFGLVVLSPLFAVVAALIRLDSPGPAIFTQTRIGRDGVPFTFYKFRSMCVDNDCESHRTYVARLIKGGEGLRGENGSYKIEADPRVTRVGHFLRRTSIDELPQLYNVLRGEMSLVGPRPPLPYEAELYTREQWRRLEPLPGMTGLWQVSGRAETTFDRMVELDIEYGETRTFWMDLRILLRTVSVVLGRKGAW